MEGLLVHQRAQKCKSATNTKSDHKGCQEIDQDVGLVGFTGFAVVFGPAVLAFDMCEQVRAQRATPPGEFHFCSVCASTFWAGGILGFA